MCRAPRFRNPGLTRPAGPSLTHPASAFTLLETLIAATLLVASLLGMAASISLCVRLDMNAAENTSALNAARARLEALQAMPRETLPALQGTTFLVPGLKGAETVGTVAIDTSDPTLYAIAVTVSWHGILGERSLTLRTQVADQ